MDLFRKLFASPKTCNTRNFLKAEWTQRDPNERTHLRTASLIFHCPFLSIGFVIDFYVLFDTCSKMSIWYLTFHVFVFVDFKFLDLHLTTLDVDMFHTLLSSFSFAWMWANNTKLWEDHLGPQIPEHLNKKCPYGNGSHFWDIFEFVFLLKTCQKTF